MSYVMSNYLGNLMLHNTLCRYGGYVAPHTADPTTLGDASTELAGVTRRWVSFSEASGKAVVSMVSVLMTEVPASTIPYLGLWDAPVGGNFLIPWSLGDPGLVVGALGQVIIPAGDLSFQL